MRQSMLLRPKNKLACLRASDLVMANRKAGRRLRIVVRQRTRKKATLNA